MKKNIESVSCAVHSYRSLHRSARALVHRGGVCLSAAVVLYKVASSRLFVPLMQQLWALTLRKAPMHYLNNRNATDIFASPAILGGIVLIAVLTAFWTLFEFSVVLHGLDLARRGETLHLPALLRCSLRDIRHALLPQNWLVLVWCVLLVPFTSFFLASDYITQLAVPEYLLGMLQAALRKHPLSMAVGVLPVLLQVGGVLVLPLFVLERKSLWQSLRESAVTLHRRIVPTLLLLLCWDLSVMVRAAALVVLTVLPLYGIVLAVGMKSTAGMFALAQACHTVEVPFFRLLLDSFATLARCALLMLLYFRLRGDADTVPDNRPRHGKAVVAAAVAGVTALTFLLSAVYLVLPADHELRSLLGGTDPIITAHRGASSAAPENTLPAFQQAIECGCQRAELDVQMTRDGIVMVTHDTSLRRCTGRSANIYDLTFAQVRRLDAGQWFGSRYAGTKVPTLEEVLDLCKGRIQLNIEIKPSAATPELEAETLRIIREKDFVQDCVITSQSYETLCKVKQLAPEIPTGYILALGVGGYYDLPAADFFSVEGTFITSGMVQQIHKRGKTISAWTINRPEDATELLSLGVDDIITDRPAMVQELLRQDADPAGGLLLIRDALRDWFASQNETVPDPADAVIEEAVEDPEEVLDAA